MVQLPPPVHGAALRNKSLLESSVINEEFNIVPLPLFFADEVKDIGKFSFRKLGKTWSYCLGLVKILSRQRIDLAYFTLSPFGFAFYRDLLIVTILKCFRVKRLYHFRIKGIRSTAGSRIGKPLVKYALKGADIICLSQHHLSDFDNLYTRRPYIVPNGIKVEAVETLTPPERSPSQPIKILFISNLARAKGVFDLLEALRLLHLRGIDFTAQLVGAEHDITYEELKKAIEAGGMANKVSVPGAKFGQEKFRLLTEADIFVFPTCFELFPGVILEAMQFGKAVIASTEGSLPEIIDNHVNGILVPKQDPVALSHAIKQLLDDAGLRSELGQNAREKFFAQYTLDKFENKMKEVFEYVLQ